MCLSRVSALDARGLAHARFDDARARAQVRDRAGLSRGELQHAPSPPASNDSIDLKFCWCLRVGETGVEASEDGECPGKPRTVRVV